MITAKEAREKIDTLRQSTEQEKIERRIASAVARGDDCCEFNDYFSATTLAWLQSLGYKVVDLTDPRDGIHVIGVMW